MVVVVLVVAGFGGPADGFRTGRRKRDPALTCVFMSINRAMMVTTMITDHDC